MGREAEPEEQDEKPEECDFCGYPTEKLEFYKYSHADVENAWLCEVCASTAAGTAYHFPRQYDQKEIMKQISFCANMILERIERGITQRTPDAGDSLAESELSNDEMDDTFEII